VYVVFIFNSWMEVRWLIFISVHNMYSCNVSSAFVGLAVIILMFPIPGYLAKVIQGAQVEKMKKVHTFVILYADARQTQRFIDGCTCTDSYRKYVDIVRDVSID
jgi:hypothetical protein